MKKLKRIISISLALIILCSNLVFAETTDETKSALKFSDLYENYWAYESIGKINTAGYINGYPDGTFNPNGNITRAEFVKIANQVFSYTQKQETTNFTDVKQSDWFYDGVLVAQKAGYINGYLDNTFKPNEPITRQELCKILDSINKFVKLPYDKVPSDDVSPWAVDYVNKVISNRIMTLDIRNNFRATQNATRAEACDALAKFIIDQPEIITPVGGSTGTTEQELSDTMNTVIRRLEIGTISDLEIKSDAQLDIIDDVINSMNNYMSDSNYDYEAAALKTRAKYDKLTKEEQDDLKTQIQLNNTTNDLLELKDFFFPNAEIK